MPLQIRQAATVVCLRRRPAGDGAEGRKRELRREAYDFQNDWTEFGDVFGPRAGRPAAAQSVRAHGSPPDGGVLRFDSEWQVLMGQSEVVNWVKSSADAVRLMRYGGEWKFAGGAVDVGETLLQAARRELEEEFATEVPGSAELFLFNVTQTKPVQGRSYSMFNFVCFAEENPWLAALDCDTINAALARRHARFEQLRRSGEFFSMDRHGREAVAPEVRRIEWLDMVDAVHMCMTSKCTPLQPVNTFQAEELARHGVTERDPMFVTMATMLALEECPTAAAVRAAGTGLGAAQERAERGADNMRRRYGDGGAARGNGVEPRL